MTKSELRKGLKEIARGLISSYGLDISNDSRKLLNRMIETGVDNLSPTSELDRPTIIRAQQDITLIVSEMARIAIENKDSRLGENSFVKIRKFFCPMPPWFPAPC